MRIRVDFRGIVQGVGFRPFIYKLARDLQLGGYVLNSSEGAVAEIEGSAHAVASFLETVRREAPPLARIEQMLVTDLALEGATEFLIRDSLAQDGRFALISPDVATCDECRRDFTDPADRRYGYPFTNCTNCGPRYTIIRDIPYDRPNTTMAQFQMCAPCQTEYDDPGNRRFHAQPNACPRCGPRLSMPIDEARRLLREGRIVALKGLGGFQLACDAFNGEAVRLLRERKKRSDKPFALMARDVAAIERICMVAAQDRAALESERRPIVVLPRRADAAIASYVAPGNNTLGVMLPYTPLHHLLFDDTLSVLVMTSGNISEEPIVTDNEEAAQRLRGVADTFLAHDRDIYMRVDDSVVRAFEGRERVLRRARGYVPRAIDLGRELPELLACGAELKNSFCLTKGSYALVSQHIGDLENYETLVFFQETLANLKKLFRVEPRAVAYDLHPLYLSTKFALELPEIEKIAVQHHHAHVASCMAENGLNEKVIGVAFDGTGYGTDGCIWGGEFLAADYAGFERRAHFRYVPLPGGDAAVRQPWRSALSYLRDAFGTQLPDLPLFERLAEKNVKTVRAMIERGVNCVPTSSCGRLFDAVASILDIRQEINFEGQAAIELETAAAADVGDRYDFALDGQRIDMRPAITEIVRDVRRAQPIGAIAARFHNTVAAVVVEVCERIRREDSLRRVCLSGGTFQNWMLLGKVVNGLRARGLEVYMHAQVPPNDGGIALGQAVITAETMQG